MCSGSLALHCIFCSDAASGLSELQQFRTDESMTGGVNKMRKIKCGKSA